MKRHIFLIGFMGSGKSFVGQRLAEKLNYSFIDLDKEIEKATGNTIKKIFVRYGEHYFRKKENEILSTLKDKIIKSCVIATGGGIILNPLNVKIMKQMGQIVFLNTEWKTIWHNIKNSSDSRPLLDNKTEIDIKILYLARLPLYKRYADKVITDCKTFDINKLVQCG